MDSYKLCYPMDKWGFISVEMSPDEAKQMLEFLHKDANLHRVAFKLEVELEKWVD